jgi:crotonobetainyl-CoA:carnitine CoA-transferase CaiB-like acyl-CoA transferase
LSGSTEPVARSAPLLGQHNTEILQELLGYSEEQVGQLKKEAII